MKIKLFIVLLLLCSNVYSKVKINHEEFIENFKDNNTEAIYQSILELKNASKKTSAKEVEIYKKYYILALKKFNKENDYQKVYSTFVDIYKSKIFNVDKDFIEKITADVLYSIKNDTNCKKKSDFILEIVENGAADTNFNYLPRILSKYFFKSSFLQYEKNNTCIEDNFNLFLEFEFAKIKKSKKYNSLNAARVTNLMFEEIKKLTGKNDKFKYFISIKYFYIELVKNKRGVAAIEYLNEVYNFLPPFLLEEILIISESEILEINSSPSILDINKLKLIAKYLASDKWPFQTSRDVVISKLIRTVLKKGEVNDGMLVILSEVLLKSLKTKEKKDASKIYDRILNVDASRFAKNLEELEITKLLMSGFKIRAALYMGDIKTAAQIYDNNIEAVNNYFGNQKFHLEKGRLTPDILVVLLQPYLEYDIFLGKIDSAKKIIELAVKIQEIDLDRISDKEYLILNKEKYYNSVNNFLNILKLYYKFSKEKEKESGVKLAIAILVPESYKEIDAIFEGLFSALQTANHDQGKFYLEIFKDNLYYYAQEIAYPIYFDMYLNFVQAFDHMGDENFDKNNLLELQRDSLGKFLDNLGLIFFIDSSRLGYSVKISLLMNLFEMSLALDKTDEAYAYAQIYLDALAVGVIAIDNKNLSIEFKESQSENIEKIIQFFFENDHLVEARKAMSIFKQQSFLKFIDRQGSVMRGLDSKNENYEKLISIKINSINAQLKLANQQIGLTQNIEDKSKLQRLRDSLSNELKLVYKTSMGDAESKKYATETTGFILNGGHAYIDYFIKNDKLNIIYQDKNTFKKLSRSLDIKDFAKSIQVLSSLHIDGDDRRIQKSVSLIYDILFSSVENLLLDSKISYLHIRANSYLASIPLKYVIGASNSSLSDVNIIYKGISSPDSREFVLGEKSALFASTKKFGDLPSLKSADIEVNYIHDSYKTKFPTKSGSRVFINKDFSFQKLVSEFSSSTNVIHIASHYIPDRNVGGLLLGTGQIVTPKQIWNAISSSPTSKLVTISACESGLFNDQGQSMEDLPNVFLSKGATFVVASLWKISDVATADFMRLFYDLVMISGDPPTALNLTQSSFADGNFSKVVSRFNVGSEFKSKHLSALKRYANPFFWAPFQLISSN